MKWLPVLKHADKIVPFIGNCAFGYTEKPSTLMLHPLLEVTVSIGTRMLRERNVSKRVAVVLPRNLDCARWTATGLSLFNMLEDFTEDHEKLPPLRRGERLIVDGHYIVDYAGEAMIEGGRFYKLRLGGDLKSFVLLPVRQRIRLQPTSPEKKLSGKPKPRHHDLIDEILGIGALGNRSFYKHSVVLASSRTKTKEWIREIYLSTDSGENDTHPVLFGDVFQWSGINTGGDVEPLGNARITCKPQVVVASDLLSVEELVTGGNFETNLIILDGGSQFSKDLQTFDEILDSGLPVMSFIEQKEVEEASMLLKRDFDFWIWTKDDFRDPDFGANVCGVRNNPFFFLDRTLRNFSDFSLNHVECPSQLLQEVEKRVFRLDREVKSEQGKLIVNHFYYCLLGLARLLIPRAAPEAKEPIKRITDRLESAERELTINKVWFSPMAIKTAKSIIEGMRKSISSHQVKAKVDALNKLFSEDLVSCSGPVAVVLGNSDDVQPTSEYWKGRLVNSNKVHFCSPSDMDEKEDYEAIVVCGWLGARKMFSMMRSYLAPEVYILANEFEGQWIKSSTVKWEREEIKQPPKTRTKLLGTADAEAKREDVRLPPPVLPPDIFDISDFELKLRQYKQQALASSRIAGEDTVSTRLVEFAQGYCAFLTDTHHVPVVTDYVLGRVESGEIPQKTIDHLRVGDFLLFKETTAGNLIRAVADHGLAASGKADLRKTSSLWHEALQTFRDKQGGDTPLTIRKLKQGGCKRVSVTIRGWINSDHTIGPIDEDDIRIIAEVTGDKMLQSRLEEIKLAIREVRSAHLQASNFLVKQLLQAAPKQLIEMKKSSFEIDIEDIGKAVVVRIEEIGEEDVTVSFSNVNRLLTEVMES
jgi:hypothetical protein